jgi:hypothetical protein
VVASTPKATAGWIEPLVVLSGYLVSTLFMTYPVALVLTRAIPMDHQIKDWYPGDGDPWHYLWAFWYFKRAFASFPPHLFWTDLVFYPIGFEMPFVTGVGAILAPAALLAPLVGLTLTYNLLWILSFVLAGYGMYLLARYLFRDGLVAFFCGHVFMFSSYRMAHGREHLPVLVASFLIPLFALCLFKATEQPTTKRWVFCALVWAASTGISWYCTISLFIYLVVFALLRTRGRWPKNLTVRHLRSVAVALLVFVVAAAPFVLPLMLSPARDSIVNRPLTESNVYTADLLAFFVPSPTNPVFGNLTGSTYRRFTGNPYEQTVYLGYMLLVLSLFGVLRSSKEKTRLFLVVAVTFFVLALGPFLHVYGQHRFQPGGEELSVPLPYLLLQYVPFVNGTRVPSRFTEVLVFSLAVLAGYGLSAICAHVTTLRRRAALVGVLLVGVAIESASAPFPVVSTKAPSIYSEIGAVHEPFMVLELPLDWHIIKYHYYQAIHGKRMLVGHPVRSREKYTAYPVGLPLIPFLKDPKLLLDRPAPADAGRDAERLAAFFDIRDIVIHRRYLDPPVFERLDRFVADHFPHVSRREDDEVVVYALRRPDARSTLWPEDYVIDFGAPSREFALLSGWSWDERWGATTAQWSSDRESSIYLYLNEPADRVLEMRLLPLVYEGSPRQTIAVYVNGVLHERLTLEREWTKYELQLPAKLFRTGLNEVTFKYGHAVSPARVIPGSSDSRTLAVAFDYVALRRAR